MLGYLACMYKIHVHSKLLDRIENKVIDKEKP